MLLVDIVWYSLAFSYSWALVNKIFQLSVDFGKFGHYVTINKTLNAIICVSVLLRENTERNYTEITLQPVRA